MHELQRTVDIERYVGELQGLFGVIGGLDHYARTVGARNKVTLGFRRRTHVYLGEYLARARRSDLTPQDGFAALVLDTLIPASETAPR